MHFFCTVIFSKTKKGKNNRFIDYDITVDFDNKVKTFSIDEDTWNTFKSGEKIEICLIKGALGYEVIEYFGPKNKAWE